MWTPIPSQAGTTAAAVPTTAPRLLLLEDIHKHTLNCTPGWGPCSTSTWSCPTWAVWPIYEHRVPFLGLPIQPFLLISQSQELPLGTLCGPLLSCCCGAEGPILGSLHCQKCHPPCPEDSQTSSYSCKQGHPSQRGLLAEVRHQDLALRTDICKSVFLFLLPLCFSNKDKATRKKGTWNSVKNTQKGSTK